MFVDEFVNNRWKLHQTATVSFILDYECFLNGSNFIKNLLEATWIQNYILPWFLLLMKNRESTQLVRQNKVEKKSSACWRGKVQLIRLLAFHNFPLFGLLNFPSTTMDYLPRIMRYFYEGNFMSSSEDDGGSDSVLKENAGAIKRGFCDFLFSVDWRRFLLLKMKLF